MRSLSMSGQLDGASGLPAAGQPLCRFIPRSIRSGQRYCRLAGFAFEP
jgi:hypothetical protein